MRPQRWNLSPGLLSPACLVRAGRGFELAYSACLNQLSSHHRQMVVMVVMVAMMMNMRCRAGSRAVTAAQASSDFPPGAFANARLPCLYPRKVLGLKSAKVQQDKWCGYETGSERIILARWRERRSAHCGERALGTNWAGAKKDGGGLQKEAN